MRPPVTQISIPAAVPRTLMTAPTATRNNSTVNHHLWLPLNDEHSSTTPQTIKIFYKKLNWRDSAPSPAPMPGRICGHSAERLDVERLERGERRGRGPGGRRAARSFVVR